MRITYYIWANNELLGSVSEINLRTAMQKASIIARYSGVKKFELSTSCNPSPLIISGGKMAEVNNKPSSKWQTISNLLSKEQEIRQ